MDAAIGGRILILGGSGFVGRAVCERLVERHGGAARIVLPTRRPQHVQRLQHLPGLEPVPADIHDPATLAALASGCDAVVNLVGILHGSAAAFDVAHARLPARIAAACEAAGVRRVVHVSAIGAASGAASAYLRSKAAGEKAIAESGLAWTLLRPSVIFGAEDRFMNLFARLQAWLPVMALAGGGARFQPVWVDDVATAIVRCLDDRATIGKTYEIAGPDVCTLAELVRLAGRWSGHPRPILPLPRAIGWLQALLFEALPGEPLMSRDNLRSMQHDNVASGALPGLAELGIAPAALAAVAPGYLSPDAGRARLGRWRAIARRG